MADELQAMELLSNLHDTSTTDMAKAPQRRSACDDCRARKVQCSGDLAGCARCRRAGIQCSYSAPKPPGRPRKVRKIAEDQRTNAEVPQPFQQLLSAGFNFGDIYGGGEFNMGTPFGSNADLFDESLLQSNNFNFPSFNATTSVPPATPKSFSSISSPPPLFPWSPPGDSPSAITTTCNGVSVTIQPCSCLPAFFNSISILRTPSSTFDGFSLPTTLTTLRTTRSVITTSMQCRYCHSSVQSTYVCMMLLGTLLPLLLLYIENVLKAISSTGASSVTLSGGIEVEMERDVWIGVARGAVKKEFDAVMKLVDEIEGILEKRHCEGKEKEGLGAIARGGPREDGVGEVVGRELTNRSHETGEPPFCLGLLWMIRKMGERVNAGASVIC
ncbi:hypothetical protein BDD12DRAFT_876856 [Trichophaea hybrida]|nr:hypothetical protein BDD12DRAFT_876856 [Trichophaea hybrida]